ncbi:MAG: phage major tail tube protein [Sphingobium sp. 66-54]|nr:MAG: phage major tail tube protein [Sphingobium sp. 66-54]
MGLPSVLKNMNMFLNGVTCVGEIPEVTVPPLARKMENYRGGGLDGTLAIDLGMADDPITFEWKPGGLMERVYDGFGGATIDSEMIRWVGAHQDDGTGQMKAVEITVRGRHSSIEDGTQKPGELGERTVTTLCSFYQMTIDGREKIYIDVPNMICRVNGVDRLAQSRAILGI